MTTQLPDDLRFQNLPPEEVRQQIRKSMDAKNIKYLLINETSWYNGQTRCKHNIYNMPIFAPYDCSDRPKAVTEINVQKNVENSWQDIDSYVYNKDYVHQNISTKVTTGDSYSGSSGTYVLTDCDDANKRYVIEYESICNPITMHHFFIKDLDELALLFKGQLMGQNKGSPFRSITSVAGTYIDRSLFDSNNLFIKRSAPIIQLLSKQSISNLQNTNNLVRILQNTTFPKTEKEIAYKPINLNHYIVVEQDQFELAKFNKEVSAYYPVITADMCKELTENIPRIETEFACFGLGSAGTGVLDQLSRSNFFNSYLLVDFDRVEEKNLRNQWYETNQIGNPKAVSCQNKLRNRSRASRDITYKDARFQEIDFHFYDFKYAMAAFDSIDTRLEFLDKATADSAKVRYLIDTRYDDLTASVFFIDLQKPEEVEFYRKGLLADKEVFDKQKELLRVTSPEKLIQFLDERHCFTDTCGTCRSFLTKEVSTHIPNKEIKTPEEIVDLLPNIVCPRHNGAPCECGSEICKKVFTDFYEDYPEVCNDLYLSEGESSCLRQNFIDIYHYASTFVFDAIRLIESEKEKPFTQVDVTTDPLPASIILRR